MAAVAQEQGAAALARRQAGELLSGDAIAKIALGTFLGAFFLGLFGFAAWLAVGVSDLKADLKSGLVRIEGAQAVQDEKLARIEAAQAVQGEQLVQIVARLDRMDAAQAAQDERLAAGVAENRALLLKVLEGREGG